jgi:hypothetical protein
MTSRVVGCVAVLFLTFAGPTDGQRILSGIEVGGHVGFDASDADIRDKRVGLRCTARLDAVPLGIQGAISWYLPHEIGESIGGRQYWVTAIVYPASRWWYLGVGVTHLRLTTDVPPESRSFILGDPVTGTMTQTGVTLPIGPLSLFGELQILNTFTPDKGLGALFFSGLSVSL